ncbi:hypothetical protein [Acidocella aromatica]|uniref:Uncharacterized protein n=1 Tax=Acidocella aromatica TaxID=1303579 RepID=A0A840VL88_9PROT|nr:hypothetical protein [Acidocella aromatica]MBB5372341.1 hypothetical protein [Acidocella aromatica]
MDIRFHEHSMALGHYTKQPGEVAGDGGAPHSSTCAHDSDDTPAARGVLPHGLARNERREMPGHGLARDGLEQILHHAHAARDVPVEIDVVVIANDEHAHAGLHHIGEFAECVQRLLLARNIDDQHLGGLHLGHGGNSRANSAAADVDTIGDKIAQAVAQHLLGGGIPQEGKNGQAIRPTDQIAIPLHVTSTLLAHKSSYPLHRECGLLLIGRH